MILIVDDEPDMRELCRQFFRKRVKSGELRLLFASSGTEALEE